MTKQLNPLLIATFSILAGCATTPMPETTSKQPPALTTYQQKASYAEGVDYMTGLRQNDLNVDQDTFLLGVNDVLANRELRLSALEMTKAKDWQLVEGVKHQEVKAAANLAAGKAFMANNQSQPGVKALPSGVQYKILTEGSGANKPKATDTIAINYRLTNTNGVEIDSTAKRGKPAVTALKNLIPGAKEALQLMHKGDKWQLFLPSNLAYGENGTPDGKIKPNETLVFDMELVDINPPKALDTAKAKQDAASMQPKPSSSW
ncbi:MAG: FKBP-type peptidyl-prolyl cis-trans isomerase [Methyloglobulus sp.]|nr:FKBP-type peptidyl-prolyl cis-trans isomerase [Methyloglobulus sp.]